MHVILLGAIGEARNPLHDRIVGLGDVDVIVDDVAGMGDPLAAAHELIVDAVAERVAHAAVIAGEADAASHCGGQVLDLFLFDLRHRDDRHDEAHVGDRRIGEGLGGVFDIDLEVVLLEHLGDDMRALLRLMAAPASPDDERFAHLFLRSNPVFSRVRRRESVGGKGAGRCGRVEIATALPASDDVWNASITSSTWNASSPLARCGRPERIACAMSARPTMR